jgi:hypothetical protein
MKPKIFHVSKTPKGLDKILSVRPDVAASYYCAVINVADSPCATFDYQLRVPSFWFPINEIGQWGHSPFFGTLRVADHYFKGDKPVLIHCHAGANRSPSIAFAILLAKGYTVEEAEESLNYPNLHEVFQRNLTRKHIPQNIIEFLQEANVNDDSLHFILRKLDGDYAEWSQSKFEEQNDYALVGNAEKKARLVYDKSTKRFVVKTEVIPFVDSPLKRPEWQSTPIIPPTKV